MINAFFPLGYIDPMSGAVVLQLIIAFIAGTATFFRHTIFGGLKRILSGSQNKSAN